MFAPMPNLGLILRRGVKRGLLSAIRQEGWGVSVASLFGVLFLGQIIILLAIGAHAGLILLKEQTDIRLEVLETATDMQIQDLLQKLLGLPYLEKGGVLYVTREQAFERERKRDPQLIAFLTKFGITNPFPETIGIRLRSLDDYPKLRKFLEQPVFAKTINPRFLSQSTDQESQIYKLIDVVSAARMFLLFIVALLILALVFLVVELVRRRILLKRRELFVEQLVGATPLSILLPFSVEIAALLLAALLISLVFVGACVVALPVLIPSLAPGGLFYAWSSITGAMFTSLLPWLLIAELLTLPAIAAVGTTASLLPRLRSSTLLT